MRGSARIFNRRNTRMTNTAASIASNITCLELKSEQDLESELQDLSEDGIQEILKKQDSRKLSAFEATKLEKEAKKHWDIFYKKNENRFFKDRHWTLREFQEILGDEFKASPQGKSDSSCTGSGSSEIVTGSEVSLVEIGCGVGNFAFPILEAVSNLKIWTCDFSPRAIDLVKANPKYNEDRIHAFVCDITQDDCFSSETVLKNEKVDFVSLIFVLSAIAPEKHEKVVDNILQITKVGTVVCFRDYGRYDMAQLRFKGGKKIQDNFYARRDGTRAYYFTPEEIRALFLGSGKFKEVQCEFVHRRTVNVKENINVGRIFVQAKFERNS